MKLITLTNRKGTTDTYATNYSFKCMFNNIVELPSNAQIALGGWKLDLETPATHQRLYLNLTNLQMGSVMGNNTSGNVSTSALMGFAIPTNGMISPALRFLDLNNPEPLRLSFLDVLVTNAVGLPTDKLTIAESEVVFDLYYRQKKHNK